jgi:hypothetical protein
MEVILPDGTERAFDGIQAEGWPDPDGWLTVTFPSPKPGQPPEYGFANFRSGGVKRLARPFRVFPADRTRWLQNGNRFVYLGLAAGVLDLVEETPTTIRVFPLGLPDDDSVALRDANSSVVVTTGWGLPRWRWHPEDGLRPLPLVEPRSSPMLLHGAGRWLLLTSGERPPVPRYVLDLERLEIHAVPAVPAPPAPIPSYLLARSAIQWAGDRWFLGDHGSRPAWRLDATTREIVSVDLARLAPLRPFRETATCPKDVSAHPHLAEDGRIGLGLRTDSMGGFYLGHPGEGAWTRLGLPVTGVDWLAGAAHPLANGFNISAGPFSRFGTGCTSEPWSPPVAGPPRTVVGDSYQFMPPGGRDPVVVYEGSRPPGYTWIDPSGRCMVSGTTLQDLVTGARAEVGPFEFLHWPRP